MQQAFTKVHMKSTYIFVGRVDRKLAATGIERSFRIWLRAQFLWKLSMHGTIKK